MQISEYESPSGGVATKLEVFGGTFNIELCTLDDIDPHYEKVKHWITDMKPSAYKARMREAVEIGKAFKLADSSSFLYYILTNPQIGEGVAYYGKGNPLGTIAMIIAIFGYLDKRTFAIRFALHDGKSIDEYRSIITKSSLSRYITSGTHVMARTDDLIKKYKALVEARGEEWA
jgi:hypothetical protein